MPRNSQMTDSNVCSCGRICTDGFGQRFYRPLSGRTEPLPEQPPTCERCGICSDGVLGDPHGWDYVAQGIDPNVYWQST